MNLKKITLDGKPLSDYTEGKVTENPTFSMDGKSFRSIYDLKKETKAEEKLITSESVGTESYHFDPNIPFLLWTDGISSFIREENCVWLLSLVAGYMKETSLVTAQVSKNGEISYNENPKGKDNFLYVTVTKGEDNDALFTIEHDDFSDGEETVRNIVTQYIPYTDIRESVFLYVENSVLLFPSEH